jgi:hypothetical protein
MAFDIADVVTPSERAELYPLNFELARRFR